MDSVSVHTTVLEYVWTAAPHSKALFAAFRFIFFKSTVESGDTRVRSRQLEPHCLGQAPPTQLWAPDPGPFGSPSSGSRSQWDEKGLNLGLRRVEAHLRAHAFLVGSFSWVLAD